MSQAIKAVFDIMQGAENAEAHLAIANKYKKQQTERAIKMRQTPATQINYEQELMKETMDMDFMSLEKIMISLTEKNILSDLNMPDKFTLGSMARGFDILAKSKADSSDARADQLEYTSKVGLTFESDQEVFLMPNAMEVSMSERTDVSVARDEMLATKITESLANVGADDTLCLPFTVIKEKHTHTQDMRHMFMKLYLYLMDYNLAVTSNSDTKQIAAIPPVELIDVTNGERMAVMIDHRIVVDSTGMTPQELGLLSLAAAEYPSVMYTSASNIYTMLRMDADDLRILNNENKVMDESMNFGSPDMLYRLIVSLACKMDAIDCMREAFSTMRGIPSLLRKVSSYTSQNTVVMNVPLSRSLTRSLGTSINWSVVPERWPGYLSTSVSLCADLLLGMSVDAASTLVIEEMGGIGDVVCNGVATQNRTYCSLVRDWGVKNASPQTNTLLQEWERTLGRPWKWGISNMLGEYFLKRTQEIRDGIDLELPQLLYALPYSPNLKTAFGLSRGWSHALKIWEGTVLERDESLHKTAAFTWVLGMRKVRPNVGRNTLRKKEVALSSLEQQFLSCAKGSYNVSCIAYTMVDSLGAREDVAELVAKNFFKTEFAGTRGILICETGSGEMVFTGKIIRPDPRKTIGKEDDGLQATRQPVKTSDAGYRISPVFSMKSTAATVYDKMSALKTQDKVSVGHKVRHVRANSRGSAVTDTYKTGHGESNMLRPAQDIVEEGHIAVDTIAAPGDGKCGLHALVATMTAHGMVSALERDQAFNELEKEFPGQTWHDDAQLGAIANAWGLTLNVIAPQGNGSAVLHHYRGPGDSPTVHIINRGGVHWEGAVKGADEHFAISGKVEMQADRQGLADLEHIFRVD